MNIYYIMIINIWPSLNRFSYVNDTMIYPFISVYIQRLNWYYIDQYGDGSAWRTFLLGTALNLMNNWRMCFFGSTGWMFNKCSPLLTYLFTACSTLVSKSKCLQFQFTLNLRFLSTRTSIHWERQQSMGSHIVCIKISNTKICINFFSFLSELDILLEKQYSN